MKTLPKDLVAVTSWAEPAFVQRLLKNQGWRVHLLWFKIAGPMMRALRDRRTYFITVISGAAVDIASNTED